MRLRTIALVPLVTLLAGLAGITPAFSVQLVTSQSYAVANLAAQYIDVPFKWEVIQNNKEIVITDNIALHAEEFFGTPYCHGGTGPNCYDCSGFTQQVLGDLGIDVPRTAGEQYKISKTVNKEEVRAGDLVFFFSGNYVYHVGIYKGDNTMIHSPKPGRVVRLEGIWSDNVKFGRITE